VPSSYVIGEHFEDFVKDQVRQGRYANASEVVRDGLRALEDIEALRVAKLQALRAEVQRGADSGASIPAATVFADLRKSVAGGRKKRVANR